MTRSFANALPIDPFLPEVVERLSSSPTAVLIAPPGAGKTTRVPLALLDAGWRGDGRILMLEPRRLAARAAARRMAETLGEAVGATVGLRVRYESRVSARTRIEVVTEGVFTRMILDAPDLPGVGAVLFDEVHERSLDTDLGLALVRDVQGALRPDLRLLLMSATLDGTGLAARLGDAPVIRSEGRMFPVETRHRPRAPRQRIEDAAADAVVDALAGETGSILVFLPGQGEILRTAERLEDRVAGNVDIAPLYGALPPGAQDAAIRPAAAGRRKVVLSSAIAETSLTIEGVRIVIDGGLSRVPRFDAASGLTRLETVKVSRASADQRRGRAGRLEPGLCIRLWEEAATGSLAAADKPEILTADLSQMLLALAAFGVRDPETLAFLDPPPAPAVAAARRLLGDLGALDANGLLTADGKAMAGLALHPRLARMVSGARAEERPLAAHLAVMLSEPGLGGSAVDAGARLSGFLRARGQRAEDARRFASRLGGGGLSPATDDSAIGPLLALAYPDRIAMRRGPSAYRLRSGSGAALEPASLMPEPELAVLADLGGAGADARVRLAAPLMRDAVERLFSDAITHRRTISVDPGSRGVRVREETLLGALVLDAHPAPATGPESQDALCAFIADRGLSLLPSAPALSRLLARLRLMAPERFSDAALRLALAEWLGPFLGLPDALAKLDAATVAEALKLFFGPHRMGDLDRLLPASFTAPTGRSHPIDYEAEAGPTVRLKVQELFGLSTHPTVGPERIALVLELLSPAQRPIQVTRDLPAFFRGSWQEVRKEMRGRYPKHDWPEDPFAAAPQTGARKRH
ncbi:MAG: ATP-dependent helicase HrpB [Hyphomicrobiaceae bacterium]|nr:ATP-dependent helicase HrpB [Hyphomicrobiaceae bacterium]